MNIEIIKEKIESAIGQKVKITMYGMRNRVDNYSGVINKAYSNIFTILSKDGELSFAYRDIITKDITVKFL